MRLSSLPAYKRNAIRFTEIIRVLSKYGLAGWVKTSDPEFLKNLFKSKDGDAIVGRTTGERLRLVAEELGPTFIKLAQILSTRPDLIGPEIADELEKLQARVPADPIDVVRKTFEDEVGQSVEDAFSEFDETPIGSASIGQVHAARLEDGRAVVVKVQHPGVEKRMREDLDILEGLAGLAEEFAKDLRAVRPRDTVRELRRVLLRELDYSRELRNLEEFQRNFRDQPEVHFPVPVPELSDQRVLTMERLVGVGFHDLESEGVDAAERARVARIGANVYLDMIFRDGFYHADPHAGNLMVLENKSLGMLDCGMTGRIDPRSTEDLISLLLSVTTQDPEDMAYFVSKIGMVPPELDRGQLAAELGEFIAEYTKRPIEELDVGAAIEDGVSIIRRNQIVLRPNISLLLKVLVMLEGTSRALVRDFSLAEILDPYLQKLMRKRMSPKANFRRLMQMAKDWDRLARGFPRHANRILERVDQGQFQVNIEHRHLDTAINRLVLGIITSALFLGSSLMMAMKLPPTLFGISVFGFIGGVAAFVLAVLLLKAIHNSDDLN